MVARLECGVLAVPVHSARSDINYRAPRGIAKGMAWRSSKRRCRCKSSDAKRKFREAFQHNGALLGFSYPLFLNKHPNGKTNPGRRDPSRLILAEQLGRRSAPRLILEINIRQAPGRCR